MRISDWSSDVCSSDLKKGAPIIVEVGPRDVAGGNVAVIRRDRLYQESGKLNSAFVPRGAFIAAAVATLGEIQDNLHAEAKERLPANIRRHGTALQAQFTANGSDSRRASVEPDG